MASKSVEAKQIPQIAHLFNDFENLQKAFEFDSNFFRIRAKTFHDHVEKHEKDQLTYQIRRNENRIIG